MNLGEGEIGGEVDHVRVAESEGGHGTGPRERRRDDRSTVGHVAGPADGSSPLAGLYDAREQRPGLSLAPLGL